MEELQGKVSTQKSLLELDCSILYGLNFCWNTTDYLPYKMNTIFCFQRWHTRFITLHELMQQCKREDFITLMGKISVPTKRGPNILIYRESLKQITHFHSLKNIHLYNNLHQSIYEAMPNLMLIYKHLLLVRDKRSSPHPNQGEKRRRNHDVTKELINFVDTFDKVHLPSLLEFRFPSLQRVPIKLP